MCHVPLYVTVLSVCRFSYVALVLCKATMQVVLEGLSGRLVSADVKVRFNWR